MWRTISHLNLIRNIGSWVLLCKTRHWGGAPECEVMLEKCRSDRHAPQVSASEDSWWLFSLLHDKFKGRQQNKELHRSCLLVGLIVQVQAAWVRTSPMFSLTELYWPSISHVNDRRFQSSIWWHRAVIPCWRLRCQDSLNLGIWDQPGQHGQKPSENWKIF